MCHAVIPAQNICLPAGNYNTKNPCFTVCRIDRILHAEMLNITRVPLLKFQFMYAVPVEGCFVFLTVGLVIILK